MKLRKRIPKTTEEKSRIWKDRKYLLIAGLLFALGFSPIPLPITLFFALIPFFKVLESKRTLGDIYRATFLMSFTASLLALYWVGGYTEAKDPYLMIGGFILLFINPIAFLIPGTLYYITRKYSNSKTAILLFPFFWVFYEYLYTLTDWSFPWLLWHLTDSDIHQRSSLSGVQGIYRKEKARVLVSDNSRRAGNRSPNIWCRYAIHFQRKS
jgi:apolipoprotein N-acyltransferase